MLLKSIGSGILQGAFSFFSLGVNMAFFEYLHKKFEYKVFSVVLPSILTAAFSYVIHSINGSMRPLETALGVFVFAGFTFALMHFAMKRAKTINPVQLAKRGIKKVRRKK